MCGIVGYIGNKRDVAGLLINGLKRLEYRGYDSSGISLPQSGGLVTHKRKGKIVELEKEISRNPLEPATMGIAHTRWATHGEPNEVNAHPHCDCSKKISIVHNGIIENYSSLRTYLKENGHKFVSETDTEVVAHLIEACYNGDLAEAVRAALYQIDGTFGLAVLHADHPDCMIVARNGSPLIVGTGNNGYYVASDASAIVEHTNQVIYLNDNEMATVYADRIDITTIDNIKITPQIEEISWDIDQIEKGGYDHFMLKEIFEQAMTIKQAIHGRLDMLEGNARLDGIKLHRNELRGINRVIITACGTSWHAALIGEYMLEEMARIPVEVEYASEFRYRNPLIDDKTMVIVISQSGETADTIAALREAKNRGATVLGICNVVGSTIARETDGGVYTHAGPEIGVASTKAFTSQVAVLSLMTLLLGRMRHISREAGQEMAEAITRLPEQIDTILKLNDDIKKIAEEYADRNNCLYLGRGINFPVALEGALKLKEISYIHAEGYPAAEMKHGPIALIDENMPVVVIALKDQVYDKVISNIEEVKARKGRVIAIATEGDEQIREKADHVIYIPASHNLITPILSILPLQMLAYHVAVLKGCAIDQPRNLAKSVTVE